MPVVPFDNRQRPAQPKPLSAAEEPWVLMAAAQMDAQGRLIEPETKKDYYESRPQASFGGRSIIETNNPELGPTDVELRRRQDEMERHRRRNIK